MNFKNRNEYKWLLQKYEKLERLGLGTPWFRTPDKRNRINELCTFFERNPNVRHFSCNFLTLSYNKDALLNCKVKLDTFELIDKSFWVCECDEKEIAWDLLSRLHTHGFYKRLHINTSVIAYRGISSNLQCKPSALNHNNPISEMPFLQQLALNSMNENVAPLLTYLNEYAETSDAYYTYADENETLNLDRLMNVERLHLFRKSLDILRIIQQLKNLRKIKILGFRSAEILELNVLNREREKLADARKVTIYVPDAVYLATKWATKNGTTNLNLIEMKRANSYEWHRSCDSYNGFPTLHLPPGML
ncbi:uncharacterized protein LOC116347437 [Contarinia nasturtii]|uniref:uncharacterized protein LOC116347437 n=1 Tax=Contarinia nasturtii TaxID=265458 RepID=UPI0012D3EF9E|nr:uncharacterized protein LOC116347437 [Contarinia nasturtii]